MQTSDNKMNEGDHCLGVRYNFKKGMEICKNKDSCPIYEKDNYDEYIRFDTQKMFRQCKVHENNNPFSSPQNNEQ